MPEYKLHYFSLRGRGEPIRVILKLAGVNYTEVLYDWASEEWANAKKGILSLVVSLFTCNDYIVLY